LSAKSHQPFPREDQGLTVFPEEPSLDDDNADDNADDDADDNADDDADDDADGLHFRKVKEAALNKTEFHETEIGRVCILLLLLTKEIYN
jgi:hypothetical protein